MGKIIEVSAVIGTFNQKQILEKVLQTFAKQTFPADKLEIVLVDSNSTDGTEEMCKNANFPFIFNYCRKENTGKVSARNIGIQKAGGELIFLTDGDVLAHPDLIKKHVDYYNKYKESVIVGKQFIAPSLERYQDEGKICFKYDKIPGQRLPWNHLVTGNALISKKLLVDIGMFDEDFKGYGCEDYELGLRIAKKGVPIIYNPEAINYHYHPVTFEEDCHRKIDTGKAAVIFYRKHKSLKLKLYLGINPISLFIHKFIKPEGWFINKCKEASKSHSIWKNPARQILIEYNYLKGVREEISRINNISGDK